MNENLGFSENTTVHIIEIMFFFARDNGLCKVKLWGGQIMSANFEIGQVREFKMTSMYRLLVDFLRMGSYRSEG